MKLLKKINKNLFYIFLFVFTILGIFLSLKVGITHDEPFDLSVWEGNKNKIFNYIFKKNLDVSILDGGGKFYGSGFHYISSIFEPFFKQIYLISSYGAEAKNLVSKHATVFIFFIVSSIFFRKILLVLSKNKSFSNLGTIFYLSYPYLLGHSFFNVKDVPFLSVWLICTYYIIKISNKFFDRNIILKKHILILGSLIGYLLSIRISGVLIGIQLLIFLLIFLESTKTSFFNFIRNFYKQVFLLFAISLFIFILLQPRYWTNPLLIFDSIKFMSQHLQTVCTITLGECMKAQNLPASYLPIWFFFKLPTLILISLFLYPLTEKKINQNRKNSNVISSIALTIFLIISLLIIFEVNLYDEIRQVMFLIPLIFIISLYFLFIYSNKFFKILVPLFTIYFIFQNILIYPYNYIWVNNFSHISKVNGVFELDYWGVSSKKIADYLNNKAIDLNACVISNRNNGLKPFMSTDQCFLAFDNLHKKLERPFYVGLMERGTRKGTPNKCELIHVETEKINFSREELTLAKLYKCS